MTPEIRPSSSTTTMGAACCAAWANSSLTGVECDTTGISWIVDSGSASEPSLTARATSSSQT